MVQGFESPQDDEPAEFLTTKPGQPRSSHQEPSGPGSFRWKTKPLGSFTTNLHFKTKSEERQHLLTEVH